MENVRDGKRLQIAVLMGGTSSEREVSLMSGRKVLAALDAARYDAMPVDLADVSRAHAADLARLLFTSPSGNGGSHEADRADGRPDVVFIALHGGTGENGTVQGLLEILGLPYTGSGVMASALAINKAFSKRLFEHARIPTPKWLLLSTAERESGPKLIVAGLGLPCVVKPNCEGSTIGVTIVREESALPAALDLAFQYGEQVVVEAFIPGIEITGPVLGNDEPEVLPLIEIVPTGGFYDYEAKYTPGATEEIIPARITEAQAARARELTLAAHHALGCRGLSRVDMIVTPDEIYVLEVNTIPGMTSTSLVPRAAEAAGLSFPDLIDRLVELSLEDGARGGAKRTV